MSYKEKPLLKIFKYENNAFKLQAIIDDYQNCSYERNKFEAGQFSIQINYNIPNSQIFEKGLFIQFGNDSKDFGLIKNVSDEIGPDGKGSQIRTITGYDARILFKQRIIKNLNFGDSWSYTGSGELCMRNLINSQCGNEAENKRKLPIINTIPSSGIGSDYTVSEAYSNLYDVLVTIATQTEIGWGIEFVNNQMSLYFYNGVDRHTTVKFSTDYDSLQNGSYEDGTENFSNSVYVGGKGSGENRDIYEGETGETSPSGLDRYESWDDANSLENDDEYENEAKSKLNEYSNTVSLSGNGLAKCPYEYKKEYDVGDIITVQFSGKTAIAQILSITENWAWGQYDLQFEFGKPIPSLNRQLNFLLSKIQTYQATADSVKKSNIRYYEIPTETEMPNKDVILDVIGFEGNMGEGATFKLYFDSDSKVGAKTYHLYFKALAGSGKLTLTSGVSGKTNLELGGGTYVAIVYVDEEGNIGKVTGTSNTSELVNDANFQTNTQVQSTVNTAVSGKNDVIGLTDDEADYGDETVLVLGGNRTTNPTSFVRRTALKLWNYIKSKLISVFGYSSLAGLPHGVQTLRQDGTSYYGDKYPVFWQWVTNTVAQAKCIGYKTKVDLADTATQDSNGNNIVNTYTTKSELNSALTYRGKIYTNITQLNADKGTSIILNTGEDNTMKIINALSSRDIFIDYFSNTTAYNRFGLPESKSTHFQLQIQKIDGNFAKCTIFNDRLDNRVFVRTYNGSKEILSDWVETGSFIKTRDVRVDWSNKTWNARLGGYICNISLVELEIPTTELLISAQIIYWGNFETDNRIDVYCDNNANSVTLWSSKNSPTGYTNLRFTTYI